MSEAMVTERIVEAYWMIQRYWTYVRYPFQTKSGGWSDIDVLGFNSRRNELVIAESKVRGPKKNLYAYTEDTRSNYGTILEYDGDKYFTFLNDIGHFLENDSWMNELMPTIKRLTVQLVSNYYVDESVKQHAIKDVEKEFKEKIKESIKRPIEVSFRMDTTFDIICKLIEEENSNSQGRRYGHPVLDMIRELNRYMHPIVKYAGGREQSDKIKSEIRNQFLNVFNKKPIKQTKK